MVYEGNKDPEDHLGIFSATAEQEEWLMPVWCKMFRQTLGGAARNWFDEMDPKGVDSFKELSQKFLEEFSQQKRYAKDPTEIHGIKRRQNKGLQAFMDRFMSKSLHIKGVPPVLRISAFMHGHGRTELTKEEGNRKRPFEEGRSGLMNEVTFPAIPQSQLTDEPIILEGIVEGNRVRRILVDGGRRTRMRSLGAAASTIYSMIKFPTNQGVVTLETSRETLRECKHLERVQGSWKEVQWRQRKEQMSRIREQAILRSRSNSERRPGLGLVSLEKTRSKEDIEEVLPSAMNIRTRRLALKERVFYWLGEGLIRKEYNQIRMAENDEQKTGFHTEEGVYCFTHMLKELKNYADTLQRMMEKVLADQRGQNVEIHLEGIVIKSKSEQNLIQDVKEMLRKLRRVNIKIDPTMSSFGVREGRMEIAKEAGWTNEAEEALRRIKRKLDNKLCTTDRKERNPDTCFLCDPTSTRNGDMLHPNEKRVQALIHTTRLLRTIYRKHKVKVVTDGPIEEILKLFGKEGRLAKWAVEMRTYENSYIPRKEAKVLVMKKLFGQGEQVEGTRDANEEGTFTLSKKLQAKSTPTLRAWRLYVGKETIEEGSGVGIILVSLEEKIHSYAIHVKFHVSNHVMNYEALLAGLAASTNQGMKDLHVFIDSLTLVAHVKGSHTPVME
uniref:Reverse transcriptase domain-containing protein n=1 Tax=Tanacetum cinerariifolium TaxID=118510 RepID=A0A6L2KQ84_TANCI|nr:reverse transcriptase domain-containing protein [Tanacetum cinerariifolium]